MSNDEHHELSRRERQIMDVLFARGAATAQQIRQRIADPPSYSTVRTVLSRLEEKGYVRHTEAALRYVYHPVLSRSAAERSAIHRLIQVFFKGSVSQAVHGMLEAAQQDLSDEELDELERLIEERRQRKRGRHGR